MIEADGLCKPVLNVVTAGDMKCCKLKILPLYGFNL